MLFLQGDSHEFVTDNPLGLPNFTRIVVHGETLPLEYPRLTIDPRDPSLFSWERVAVPKRRASAALADTRRPEYLLHRRAH